MVLAGSETTPPASDPSPERKMTLVVLGDSLAAGYGIEQSQAFPALLQEKIDAAKLNYSVVNAGLSGDTSAGGLRRMDWILRRPVDVLFLELGGNDGLRGIAPGRRGRRTPPRASLSRACKCRRILASGIKRSSRQSSRSWRKRTKRF
jgi:lysophospholipase L1-like esterase